MARWFVDRLPQQGIPSVSLRRLLPEARFVGCHDWEVSGCTADSRRLDPGQVFVAVRGPRHDGHAFVPQALERGAAGVIVERPCPEAGRLQVVVPDARAAHARLCHALAGDPSEQLLTIGVTGTCGRAATSLFLRSIFEATGARFGLVGSLGWSDGVTARPMGVAPPGAEGLAAMLAEMVERGCLGGVIEVSGEVLERRRVEGLAFDAAVVTDLGALADPSPEALRARRRSKARLFRKVVPGGLAVVNADDPHAELLGAVNLDARRVSFAVERPADVTAKIERLDARGTRFLLRGFDREAAVELRLIGPAPVSQALAAAAVAWSRGLAIDAVVAGLESVAQVPGRLEAVAEGQGFEVRIDQARDGLELRQALAALRADRRGDHPLRRRRRGAAGPRRAARAGPGGRGGRRPRDPDDRQPPHRGPRPDPRRPALRLPPPGPGPRRARPPTRHRGRPGRRAAGRRRPDRRQGPSRPSRSSPTASSPSTTARSPPGGSARRARPPGRSSA